jgi:hypothetical protein
MIEVPVAPNRSSMKWTRTPARWWSTYDTLSKHYGFIPHTLSDDSDLCGVLVASVPETKIMVALKKQPDRSVETAAQPCSGRTMLLSEGSDDDHIDQETFLGKKTQHINNTDSDPNSS